MWRATPTDQKPALLVQVLVVYTVVAMLGSAGWHLRNQLQPLPVTTTIAAVHHKPQVPLIAGGMPQTLSLPEYNLLLDVLPGSYDPSDDSWNIASYKTQYILGTAWPNNKNGNTVIYGHNNMKVFGHTKELAPGDVATLSTASGHTFTYQYVDDQVVDPSDTSVLTTPTSRPTLTLITCTGIWNQSRRLMHFELSTVDNHAV